MSFDDILRRVAGLPAAGEDGEVAPDAVEMAAIEGRLETATGTDSVGAARPVVVRAEQPDETVESQCCRCGCAIQVPRWMRDTVAAWNKREARRSEDAEKAGGAYMPQYIRLRECAACDACDAAVRGDRDRESAIDFATTRSYLTQLRKGVYSPQGIAWLKQHGHEREVDAFFAAEGRQTP